MTIFKPVAGYVLRIFSRIVFLLVLVSVSLSASPTQSESRREPCDVPRFDDGRTVRVPTGSSPTGVATGDFDGDGITDLVVANSGDATLAVLLGTPGGSFRRASAVPSGPNPTRVVTGDFDSDGKFDVVAANSALYTGNFTLFRGDGRGGLTVSLTLAPGRWATAAAAVDINLDAKLDLVCVDFSDGCFVYLGDGAGGFGDPAPAGAGSFASDVAVGDFNGDGKPDLAVLAQADSVAIDLGRGDGTFAPSIVVPTRTVGLAVAAADLDFDGRLDLLVTEPSRNVIETLRNIGGGNFAPAGDMASGYGVQDVIAGDLDLDGRTDVVAGLYAGAGVEVWRGISGGGVAGGNVVRTGGCPTEIVFVDADRDGTPDVVATDQCSGSVVVLYGDGRGAFGSAARRYWPTPTQPIGIGAGDFDEDGMQDLAVSSIGVDRIDLFFGDGAGGYRATSTLPCEYYPRTVSVNDLDGDRHVDLVLTHDSGRVTIMLGAGDGGFGTPDVIPIDNLRPTAGVVADFDGDAIPDIAVVGRQNSIFAYVAILVGTGDGRFTLAGRYPAGHDTQSMVAADFDGDGRTDIAVSAPGTNEVSVLLGLTGGGFSEARIYPAGECAWGLAAGDLDGDDVPDLVATNQCSNDLTLLIGDGRGGFVSRPRVAIGKMPYSVLTDDFDGDGRTDIAVAVSDPAAVSVLYGNGAGGFRSRVDAVAGRYPYHLTAADFDGDGGRDIAATNVGAASVVVLLNECSGGPNNSAPVARCRDVTVAAGADGTASANVDDGSYDPDGEALVITQTPAGPYPVGETLVTTTATDPQGASSECTAIVTVVQRATVCATDDVSGETFSIVVEVGSPAYGAWTYRDGSTNRQLSGVATSIRYVEGRRLEASGSSTATLKMSLKANLRTGSLKAKVVETDTATKHRIRDRDLDDSPPCT